MRLWSIIDTELDVLRDPAITNTLRTLLDSIKSFLPVVDHRIIAHENNPLFYATCSKLINIDIPMTVSKIEERIEGDCIIDPYGVAKLWDNLVSMISYLYGEISKYDKNSFGKLMDSIQNAFVELSRIKQVKADQNVSRRDVPLSIPFFDEWSVPYFAENIEKTIEIAKRTEYKPVRV